MDNLSIIKKEYPKIIKRFQEQGLDGQKEYAFFMRKITTVIPKLNKSLIEICTPNSLISAALTIADIKLSLNPIADYIYIIPYKNKAEVQLSYKGLKHLIMRANPNINILSEIIYEGDNFRRIINTSSAQRGFNIEYIQGENYGDIERIKGAVIIIYYPNFIDSIYMSFKQLETARKQSKFPNSPAWTNFRGEMYKKVILRRAMKGLPVVPDIPENIEEDYNETPNVEDINFYDYKEIKDEKTD